MNVSELRRKGEVIVHLDDCEDIRLDNDIDAIRTFIGSLRTVRQEAPHLVDDGVDPDEISGLLSAAEFTDY